MSKLSDLNDSISNLVATLLRSFKEYAANKRCLSIIYFSLIFYCQN